MTDVAIRMLVAENLPATAQLHLGAFPQSALSKLGGEAVRRYYEWLLAGPHQTTALGAFDHDTLVAFMFGGTFKGAMTGFLHKNRGYLIRRIATRPWLVGTSLVRDRIAQAVRLLRRRERSPPAPVSAPAFGILAIAVDPRRQGTGVGKALMQRTEEIARAKRFDRMQLSVASWNTQAIAFYSRAGWQKAIVDGVWSGVMSKALIIAAPE